MFADLFLLIAVFSGMAMLIIMCLGILVSAILRDMGPFLDSRLVWNALLILVAAILASMVLMVVAAGTRI